MRRLQDSIGEDSYTLHVVALDLGLSDGLARAVWLAGGLTLLTAMVVVGRRGDERRALVLALGAALALTPIVWLHYFALLLVVVALMRPRLGLDGSFRSQWSSPRERASDTLRDCLDARCHGADNRARASWARDLAATRAEVRSA